MTLLRYDAEEISRSAKCLHIKFDLIFQRAARHYQFAALKVRPRKLIPMHVFESAQY